MKEKSVPRKLRRNLRLLIPMTLLTLGATCNHTFYEQGDFPRCPVATEGEKLAIRNLGNHEDTVEAAPLLGRIAKFCKAYHVRIGYVSGE